MKDWKNKKGIPDETTSQETPFQTIQTQKNETKSLSPSINEDGWEIRLSNMEDTLQRFEEALKKQTDKSKTDITKMEVKDLEAVFKNLQQQMFDIEKQIKKLSTTNFFSEDKNFMTFIGKDKDEVKELSNEPKKDLANTNSSFDVNLFT
jgi:hypothetical protein